MFCPSLHFVMTGLLAIHGSFSNSQLSVSTENAIKSLTGHQNEITSLASCPRLLASGGRDRTVRIWNVNKEREVCTPLKCQGEVSSVVFLDAETLGVTAEKV